MRIDPTLPHYPYAVSVAEALAETEHAPVLDQVRAEFGAPPERLQARLTRRKHAVLIWQPQLGWRHATTQGQFEAPETAPRLTTATVPAPREVARAWQNGESGQRAPLACAETAPSAGELPGRLATAVAEGELTREVAVRLCPGRQGFGFADGAGVLLGLLVLAVAEGAARASGVGGRTR